MKKGGKRFLIIPPQLAYGSKAIGNKVPSNSTLAFEIDLLRVNMFSIILVNMITFRIYLNFFYFWSRCISLFFVFL